MKKESSQYKILRGVGIYKITCLINKEFYVGSAIDLYRRKLLHFRTLKENKHHNQHLQRAWNKYGEENFAFEIIEYCEIKKLINREQHYIDTLKPYYNICKIAGSNLGIKQKIETVLKRYKAVIQFDLKGAFLEEFESVSKASIFIQLHESNISNVCKNKQKKAGGFRWQYKSDYEKGEPLPTLKYKKAKEVELFVN